MAPRNNLPRAAPRGPAARRIKADRDGDISMGVAVKGRAGVSKGSAPSSSSRSDRGVAGKSNGGILRPTAHREILRKAGAGDIPMKEARVGGSARGGLAELKVTGWQKSKASGDSDGGISALIKWLEKKASTKLGSKGKNCRVKKSHVEGSDLIIKVAPEEAAAFLRLNTWQWAGINVTIERVGGAVQEASGPSSEAEKTKLMLKGVLERRYDFETKFLNLSALGQDEELKKQHIFDAKSTASKFFPAMMRVLELSFDTPEEKDAAITSVSLANNDLQDVTVVSTLSQTLPKLHNLDLSNNKIEKLSALMLWRKRFWHLRHLILTGNPIEQTEPNYNQTIVNWYPNLRQLNGIQVRTEEDVANKAKIYDLPFPIRSALFQDEGGIAETFVRNLIAGFDSDRQALAAAYYDDMAEFSYAVNTQAPQDPANSGKKDKGEWENYLKESRNLKKISHLPARQNRLFRGTQAIAQAFSRLPKTKHPDLTTEARKWLIEAKMIPGIPDPTGQSPTGVDGFLITIHGEYDEVDPATSQALNKKRSFDRTIVLGPGSGPGGVRVVSDLLTVRGYGGSQAFEPADQLLDYATTAEPPPTVVDNVSWGPPQLPPGMTIPMAEQMVLQLAAQSSMTPAYSKMCLEQSGWSFPAAVEAFTRVKESLPAEAFVTVSQVVG
ncbi:MAG: hypothetical protein FE78DRAFT_89040 [Acidomyces sp. 'richmondensis']|nr:MAG: hypothetical protein FE78DRAFT_89040 [Acidomyces sp. 'richmondensis']